MEAGHPHLLQPLGSSLLGLLRPPQVDRTQSRDPRLDSASHPLGGHGQGGGGWHPQGLTRHELILAQLQAPAPSDQGPPPTPRESVWRVNGGGDSAGGQARYCRPAAELWLTGPGCLVCKMNGVDSMVPKSPFYSLGFVSGGWGGPD